MAIHVALSHITTYRFDRPVNLSPHVVRLRPAPHCRTPILSFSQRVEPGEHFVNWLQDPFANYQARLVFPEKTQLLQIAVDLVAEMSVYNPFDFFLEPEAAEFPFRYAPELQEELAPYLQAGPRTPRLAALLDSIDLSQPRRTQDFIVDINRRLQRDISYLIRMEPGVQTPELTLELACGSCRDTGWLLVQVLRHLGLAARFVSGYLIQLTPDVKALDGPSGATSDFTDLHAWCEVFLPGAGWIGLDPTSGLLTGEGHIPLACSPSPSSAAPVEGLVDACEVDFSHHMTVTRVYESPRVTKPYTDDQWQAVLTLGEVVDQQLRNGDVRLTQGGEPTFVAITDRDAPEWNTDAQGPTKRGYAGELIHKLIARYGPGGFLHFGQGKWYPGEQLPRWALSAVWRRDGQPCWHDASLFADERQGGQATLADANTFMLALVDALGVNPSHVQPGYEDAWYYLWRERRLPVNVDPFDARVEDELERKRLHRVFEQGLRTPTGYALPLRRDVASMGVSPGLGAANGVALRGPHWVSGPWFFRDERMYLFPGDSAMGWRLPLDSLPWATAGDRQADFTPDPFAPRRPLPDAAPLRRQFGPGSGWDAHRTGDGFAPDGTVAVQNQERGAPAGGAGRPAAAPTGTAAAVELPPARFTSAASTVRTALCVQARGGILYVFMPPLAEVEDYLELLAAIESTAQRLQVKLVLEGYPPPRDPRLVLLQVTPDPGVIEVNIHPAHNWAEIVDHTEFLYQAAFETRLGAEKFMLDGRHTGTGGGNHVVLGGATPADSPFLRRPDLLASLVAYWHNHPSLSYLFSGMFIGPTSQAPRVDEARNDQVYELDIALAELRAHRERLALDAPPWLVDRTLRNILIDVTGNTHRSEFCIDKLYSPDSATGRLGLLELRAFEMPPHARMSVVQQLLLRALIARFWNQPYTAALQRWGTALHDRFLLPTFIAMDFDDVLAELRDAGFDFDPQWFAPHHSFRFPLLGEYAASGVKLEVRMALEPWHVMGEETTAGGTARYVDSSLERLEVKLSGMADSRHVLTVNGRAVPLQPTGRSGEFVCGVRYRAWHPPSALHPSIGVHAPLTFDLVDTWMERSLGGCQYFVAHPGGRSYDTFPVNAYEAESRRLARFTGIGHTHGRMAVAPVRPSLEFPFTLDLRRRTG
ncbi:MAG: transglutaminase family protein [Burkholderiales bacterium]|nr:transglutaminase family protein [Burkholderiales bacterium]